MQILQFRIRKKAEKSGKIQPERTGGTPKNMRTISRHFAIN
jgi:hypothetical protein